LFRALNTKEEVAAWQNKVQKLVMENSPHHIPVTFHIEALCGTTIQEGVSFPSNMGRGATFDPELEEKIARIISRQEAGCGATQIFAPVLDVAREQRFGRLGEAYSEDPTLAGAMGTAYVKGIQGTETDGRTPDATAKHFLAYHLTEGGINATVSQLGDRLMMRFSENPSRKRSRRRI
jgi:beta-glucosidase